MAVVLKMKSTTFVSKRLSEKFGKLWLAAEVILFVLVGVWVRLMLCAVHDQRDKNAVTNAAAVLADCDPLRASTMRCMAFYCSCSVIHV